MKTSNTLLILILTIFSVNTSIAALNNGMVASTKTPVTLYWHIADNADVYLNGKPLRPYNPSFKTRGDEAPLPAFSTKVVLKNSDVFTVGGRRGGSYGFMLIAVDNAGKIVFKTDSNNWKVYHPGKQKNWFSPSVAKSSRKDRVSVQPDLWYPQKELNNKFNNAALSIWGQPSDNHAYLVGNVRIGKNKAKANNTPVTSTAIAKISKGMVAHYTFNGNSKDHSGNGNHGVVHGASLTQDRFGKNKAAYQFDGKDDYIEVKHSPELNFGGGEFSLSFWVKSSSKNTQMIIQKNGRTGGNTTQYWIRLNSNKNKALFLVDTGRNPDPHVGSSKVSVSDGSWHHVTAIRNKLDLLFYIDGEFISKSPSGNVNIHHKQSLVIGAQLMNGSIVSATKGAIDDIRIYNRALSNSEVQTLYNIMKSQEANTMPVTLYWHIADNADVYLNGKPLRPYNPSFKTRGDEAPLPAFSAKVVLKNGDVFTVGGRRGGSYGFMLIAVDKAGKIVFKTDSNNWKVYHPGKQKNWFSPSVAKSSQKDKVSVQPDPWYPQKELNSKFNNAALSIWGKPSDKYSYLIGKVKN